jgi:hypothetical protein
MPHLSVHELIFGHVKEPDTAVNGLLARMRQRLYPETLAVLASCWLKTLCCSGHNRVWWLQLKESMERALRDEALEPFAREILMSTHNWTERALASGGEPPSSRRRLEPPFRSLPPERVVAYLGRLLNEWLPTEVAHVLADEEEAGREAEAGIPALASARALDRVLERERLSPETLEMLLAPEFLSPKLLYPADLEILRDVVLALLGRLSAPAVPVLPAVLFGAAGGSALPAAFEEALGRASLEQTEDGEELHVPITEADALRILSHDPVRIGSVVVTMDGRAWQPWRLHRGEQNLIVYRPGERVRIDCSADHAKVAVPWPETRTSWAGAVRVEASFELFGREWRASSWEMDGESTVLHLTFARALPVAEAPPRAAAGRHLQPAYVEMGWSELERALAEAVSHNSRQPIEQMRRAELIPLAGALYALAESVQSKWRWNAKQIETKLRAVRYYQGGVVAIYGRAPWRILPAAVQSNLAARRLEPSSLELLSEIFADVAVASGETLRRGSAQPSHAA